MTAKMNIDGKLNARPRTDNVQLFVYRSLTELADGLDHFF